MQSYAARTLISLPKIDPRHTLFNTKSDGYEPVPTLRNPDNAFAYDDRDKAECLADSIKTMLTHLPSIRPHKRTPGQGRNSIESLPRPEQRSGSSYSRQGENTRQKSQNQKGTRLGWNQQ
ncbi:hypothetical protein EVAR_56915_1 [Eumeta japonica]|uniref:Uncharacterized protein n=1 Tax=Eumeta variegata TaxID=151549 RepID=A0A4C1YBR1_EUMVA|nr:hypothetical protein EVAR_56915_1 [Eumeta japonica]